MAGLRYERRVRRWLGEHPLLLEATLLCTGWISYTDAHSRQGVCSPDFWCVHDRLGLLVFEMKLSHVQAAEDQLRLLYGPVLSHLYGRGTLPLHLIEITRNVSGADPDLVCTDLASALASPLPFRILLLRPEQIRTASAASRKASASIHPFAEKDPP